MKEERNISFEEVVLNIEIGNLLDILEHQNKNRYPNQKIFVIFIRNYTYCVPFVEEGEKVFLKTIFPSRKFHKIYSKEKK